MLEILKTFNFEVVMTCLQKFLKILESSTNFQVSSLRMFGEACLSLKVLYRSRSRSLGLHL